MLKDKSSILNYEGFLSPKNGSNKTSKKGPVQIVPLLEIDSNMHMRQSQSCITGLARTFWLWDMMFGMPRNVHEGEA
jgi:hypothetical protein